MHSDFFLTMTKLILRKPQEQQFQICSEKSQAAKKALQECVAMGAVLSWEGNMREEGRRKEV